MAATSDFSNSMSSLISLMNNLKELILEANLPQHILDLPQIVVVGEQSCGKTSVLENIIGRNFLPKGFGIVTRCPLIIHTVNKNCESYAEFPEIYGDQHFTDFKKVQIEIERQMNKIAGEGKNISQTPIIVKVYSKNVPNLTLTDLPGIIQNKVADQPEEIIEITKNLTLEYIASNNSIILAVINATNDPSTSHALKVAQQVDPNGSRTLGIVTRVDLMKDNKANLQKLLNNNIFPLPKGYVGLRNMGQDHIDKNTDFYEFQQETLGFYQEHYPDLQDKMGANYLRAVLNNELCRYVREVTIPHVQNQIKERCNNLLHQLRQL